MRLKKTQFKKIITVISIFLGLAVIICAADLLLNHYFNSKNKEYDQKLIEVDNYGGFELIESNFTSLKDEIKDLKDKYDSLEPEISDAKVKQKELEALYNEAEINNEMLKASSSDKYAELHEKYENLKSQYSELLEKYNSLKNEG